MGKSYQFTNIAVSDINLSDRKYKISKNIIRDELIKSIDEFGILEPVLLMGNSDPKEVIFGFNRIDAAIKCGQSVIPAYICNSIESESYIGAVLLKSQRGDIGPIGKLKILHILDDVLNLDADLSINTVQKGLHIPAAFIKHRELADKVASFPDPLKNFTDIRDINFRLLNNMTKLHDDIIKKLSYWIEVTNLGVNSFRKILDMINDIWKRDGNIDAINDKNIEELDDTKEREQLLFESIFKLRYPNYLSLQEKLSHAKEGIASKGVSIDFPKYFESDNFTISIKVKRSEGWDKIKNRLDSIKEEDIKKLQELL